MADESLEEFVRKQFPFRPSHPDFARLREVVEIVEGIKREQGDDPAAVKAFYDRFVDAVSVAYLAAHRTGMNIPGSFPSGLRKQVHELMTNAWVEGVLFGIYFQQLGGHREDSNG